MSVESNFDLGVLIFEEDGFNLSLPIFFFGTSYHMVRHPSCVTAMEGDFILPHRGTWKCTTLQILFIYIEYNLKHNKNKQNKIAIVVCHNMRWGPLQVHHIPQRFTSIPSSPRTSEQDQKSNPMWSGLVSFWCWSKWMSTNIKYGMSHLLRQP